MKKKGFTLVELLAVIGIIGILAAIILPKFTNYVDKANEKVALSNARSIYTEMSSYYSEHGQYMPCRDFTGEGIGGDIPISKLLNKLKLSGFVCYVGHNGEEAICDGNCTPGTFKYDNKEDIYVIFDGKTFNLQ